MTDFKTDIESAGQQGKPLEIDSSHLQQNDQTSFTQGIRRQSSPGVIHQGLQILQDLLDYKRARSKFADSTEEFQSLFNHFINASTSRRCVRLVFDDDPGPDLGPEWLTVSLDEIERLANESGHVSLELGSDLFDAVLCIGIGRISRPDSLVAELRRVLKRSGQIWIQLPLCGPYLPSDADEPPEYWRFTPEGLRVLMENFDEILCSVYLPKGNALRTCSFFYGIKPADPINPYAGTVLAHTLPPYS